jgi:hypothetical protein
MNVGLDSGRQVAVEPLRVDLPMGEEEPAPRLGEEPANRYH